jgi:hypothetical protein
MTGLFHRACLNQHQKCTSGIMIENLAVEEEDEREEEEEELKE